LFFLFRTLKIEQRNPSFSTLLLLPRVVRNTVFCFLS